MRNRDRVRQVALIALLPLVLVTGCGGDGGGSADSTAVTQTPTKAESEQPPAETKADARDKAIAKVEKAAKTLKRQGTEAASSLGSVSESDLVPSEKGADLLVTRGYINEGPFCKASDVLLTSENDELLLEPDYFADHPENRDSKPFEAGWNKAASAELQDLGAALYNAIWTTRCLSP